MGDAVRESRGPRLATRGDAEERVEIGHRRDSDHKRSDDKRSDDRRSDDKRSDDRHTVLGQRRLTVSAGQLNARNIGVLKKLLRSGLPVTYYDSFYSDVLKHLEYAVLGYLSDLVVAAACAKVVRVDDDLSASTAAPSIAAPSIHTQSSTGTGTAGQHSRPLGQPKNKSGAPSPSGSRLYITALCTLAPYRNFGIGTQLLIWLLSKASLNPDLKEVLLHVQSSNERAVEFYKRFGFTIVSEVKGYYPRLPQPDAYVLSRSLPFEPDTEVELAALLEGFQVGPPDRG